MSCCNFYLDGINQLKRTAEFYFFEDRNGTKTRVSDCYSQQILLRLTLPIHVALSIIFSVNLHILRATASLIAGILTFDGEKIGACCKDLISVIVEVVALPILGIITWFAPGAGLYLLDKAMKLHSELNEVHDGRFLEPLWKTITAVVRGIFAVPIGLVTNTVLFFTGALVGSSEIVTRSLPLFFATFSAPFVSFTAGFKEGADKFVHQIHCITVT